MTPETILLDTLSAPVVDRVEVPPRSEQRAALPSGYDQGRVANWLTEMGGGSGELWSHQSLALEHLAAGRNVVVATGTASGKTLIPMAAVIKRVLENPTSTFLALYPQKSLLSDQLKRWQSAFKRAQLHPDLVSAVEGQSAMDVRVAAFTRSNLVLATDDVIHSWAMANHAAPFIRSFMARLEGITIDEAHERKGVFGSNSAFLNRRITALQQRCRAAAGLRPQPIQWLALSATIVAPAEHLEALTGAPFVVVDESENGAPSHGVSILHVAGPSHGAAAEAMLVDLLGNLAPKLGSDAVIAFVDRRQAVERITANTGLDSVEPYRAGLEADNRAAIEESLREGNLRGVVATSALEQGVDVPAFTIGLNLGVPPSRMSMWQRRGRGGRSGQSAFAIIAPENAFTKVGTTFQEFLAAEVESSPLYLTNSNIQFGQACCLLDEAGSLAAAKEALGSVTWPSGFADALVQACPGTSRPRELEQNAASRTGRPHLDFPLRRIGEGRLKLRHLHTGEGLGEIDLGKG